MYTGCLKVMEAALNHFFEEKVVMIAELPIHPEKRAEFIDYTIANLELSRSAKGNIAFDILTDENHPNQIVFYEVWESAEAQHAYMAWRVERGDLDVLLSFLAGEPKFTALKSYAG